MSPPLVRLSHPPPPLGCHRAPALGSLRPTANSHWLSILHVVMCMLVIDSASEELKP